MERGRDFLRQQVEHAAAQHRVLVESIESDKESADDTRVRELCAQYMPRGREHQVALDSYRDSLGEGAGGTKVMAAVGSFIGRAREAVGGMREDDFGRLTDDLTSIRQSQDTFSLFANAGEKINEPRLAEIGRHGARDHEEMQKDFYDLAQTIFLEQTSMESGGGRAAAD
jgi:hypothetical protein